MIQPVAIKRPRLVTSCMSDGRRTGFALHYSDTASKTLKADGFWWFAPRRMWVIDSADIGLVSSKLRSCYQGVLVDFEGLEGLVQAAFSAPQRSYFSELLDVQVFPVKTGPAEGQWAVSFTYDALAVRAARSLGARFHKPASAWQVAPGRNLEQILSAFADIAGIAAELVFVHETAVVMEQLSVGTAEDSPIQVSGASPPVREVCREEGEGDAAGSMFMSALLESGAVDPVPDDVLAVACTRAGLRDYQTAGVRHLVRQVGCCLGDDMGLGKSRQTVVAADLVAGSGRILILCPASLRINWAREIQMVFPDAIIGIVGEDRAELVRNCRWIIANYERLGGLVREADLDLGVMCIDEAHNLKEHKSGRTRNAFMLAARAKRRYVITGTPLLNREVELHTLLRLTGHELGDLTLADFRKQFAGDRGRRAELADSLQGWMLRRSKGVLSDLGSKTRQVRHISPAEGLAAYQAVIADASLQTMPKITRLRQVLESLKIDFLMDSVRALGRDDKAIIFVQYTSTVAILLEALSAAGIRAVALVGADSSRKRQASIDAFQGEADCRVFIGTLSAAGVGITLTAANYVFFASLPWTPALLRQAEDRAYRLGQKRNVISIVPLVSDTIDAGVWQIIERKQGLEEDVVEAVRSALPGQSSAAVDIERLCLAEG